MAAKKISRTATPAQKAVVAGVLAKKAAAAKKAAQAPKKVTK